MIASSCLYCWNATCVLFFFFSFTSFQAVKIYLCFKYFTHAVISRCCGNCLLPPPPPLIGCARVPSDPGNFVNSCSSPSESFSVWVLHLLLLWVVWRSRVDGSSSSVAVACRGGGGLSVLRCIGPIPALNQPQLLDHGVTP